MVKNLICCFFVSIISILLFHHLNIYSINNSRVNYSTFLSDVNNDNIIKIQINDKKVEVTKKDMTKYITYIPFHDPQLLHSLLEKNVIIAGPVPQASNFLISTLSSIFPGFLSTIMWFFLTKIISNSNGQGALFFGKSKAKMLSNSKINITFSDIAGCKEAKEDVSEIVEYLKEPGRFQKLGGKIPKGILMVGPPGTGKTLLAKAIAGEANVPFFTISGSDFVEMFVGVGASRVRDMFENARRYAPCIIFIDEIDAVGKQRGTSVGNNHDEREQTLNQILVEMDGFKVNTGIILIAATNRPDVLDPALLRPGRFDRQVVVSLPDLLGREEILKIHMRKVSVANDVIPIVIARSTPGFSGADLANLVNESALLAARCHKIAITMLEFEISKDKIIMGSERRSIVMTEHQKESTAYHESGHAIVGRLVPSHDPLHKVTIIPRGQALGITLFLPTNDIDVLVTHRQKLEGQIATLYGGRLAEEIIYGSDKVSTGASNDIRIATDLARKMVTQWGFSDKLGPILYMNEDKEFFLEKSGSQLKRFSDKTIQIIDEEVKSIIEINCQRAKKILNENIDILHAMKDALIKYETINLLQIDDLMSRKTVREPEGWNLR
ncbi:ATP-dependent zinc metalloprotease FtsH [Buchnera aphidicola (Cinara kochiana kochiana)]|uniref:ATP-dependent zinc metalloprotease FtsH n=1 Tax=Buchnera aphidicola (Cinara kochiana kochiana) TaxID=2518976 RepID=A0A451D5U5_9GAMM|nr:ATP-dependent zinc metalloprotease FtsH [Buchnera aphidicola]VFP81153.1 ATP-dependent zinc metalloprotease FtsH [Buchnera aphidicola (Cinara kochiana kochiana)]